MLLTTPRLLHSLATLARPVVCDFNRTPRRVFLVAAWTNWARGGSFLVAPSPLIRPRLERRQLPDVITTLWVSVFATDKVPASGTVEMDWLVVAHRGEVVGELRRQQSGWVLVLLTTASSSYTRVQSAAAEMRNAAIQNLEWGMPYLDSHMNNRTSHGNTSKQSCKWLDW